jgi:hypothetical protein
LSARLALRVRELALELREVERRELEAFLEVERRELDARVPLEREPLDFRDALRELPRREPELPEPCAICLSSSAWLACRGRLSHTTARE